MMEVFVELWDLSCLSLWQQEGFVAQRLTLSSFPFPLPFFFFFSMLNIFLTVFGRMPFICTSIFLNDTWCGEQV